MQKKLIALAIAGLASTAAFAQTNVTVYGIADGSFDLINTADGRTGLNNTGASTAKGDYNRVSSNSSYLGFKGTEDLGNGLKAVFQFESNVSLDTNVGGFNGVRDSFIGLSDAKFGTIVMGNLTGPTRALGAALDVNAGATSIAANSGIIGKIGGNTLSAGGLTSGTSQGAGGLGCADGVTCTSAFDSRWKNAIAYISPTFSGFTFVGAYVADENKTIESLDNSATLRTTGFDTGIKWEGSGFTAAVTYNWAQLGNVAATTIDNVRVGGKYQGSNWSVRAMWEETTADNAFAGVSSIKQQKWGIGGTYTIGKAELLAQYYQALESDVSNANDGAQLATVGVQYNLSKRTMLKGVYAWLSNDTNAYFDYGVGAAGNVGYGSTLQGVQMGVRHAF